jgi:type II secretion system protein N
MRRRLAIAGLVMAVFCVVGALTFPTDALVQATLDRVPLPDRMKVSFTSASLRPRGLRLEQVHVVREDGGPAFDAEWLRLRPSLLGLWRDGTGRPWSIGAGTCQGTIEATIGVERRATPIAVTLDNVELASCLTYVRRVDAYGRVSGMVNARIETEDPYGSDGALDIRGAAWKPGGPLEDLPLRVDAGRLVWQLAERKLELTTIDASSSDFRASGRGLVRFHTPVDDSVIDFRIAVTPGSTMPLLMRRYFDAIPGSPPGAGGTRTFRLGGTLREPRVVAIETPS